MGNLINTIGKYIENMYESSKVTIDDQVIHVYFDYIEESSPNIGKLDRWSKEFIKCNKIAIDIKTFFKVNVVRLVSKKRINLETESDRLVFLYVSSNS